MRETTFIEQKKKNWEKFERMQKNQDSNPDEVTRLFVEITDDLSYSRTFYQKRSVRVYLNYLAQMVFLKINKGKKIHIKRFFHFWTYSLPMEFARSWKAMLLSLFVFASAFTVGMLTVADDIYAATELMGEGYISMTEKNIKEGDPMAVYHKTGSSIESTYGITLNNTMVAARTYTSGLFTGLPTAAILIYNGVHIGAFHQFLHEKGVLGEALFIVWVHGVLEIAAIVIAGGAGFVLGMGLLFPGTFTRMQSFRIAAKRSFKIALSTLCILVVSGFIEGSITRYTQMPFVLKALIIGASLLFLIAYFVVYPISLYRQHIKGKSFVFEDKVPHIEEQKVVLHKVRDVGEMYNDTLSIIRFSFTNFMKGFLLTTLPLSIGFSIYYFAFETENNTELFWDINIREILLHKARTWNSLIALLGLFYTLFISSYYAMDLYVNEQQFKLLEFIKFGFKGLLKLWPLFLFLVGGFFWQSSWIYLVAILIVPFVFHYSYSGFLIGGKDYKSNWKSATDIVWQTWFGSVGMWLLLIVIPVILMFSIMKIFDGMGIGLETFIPIQFLIDNISPFVENVSALVNTVNFALYTFVGGVVVFLMIAGMVIQFHTVKERIEAIQLFERLKEFGTKNKLFEQSGEGEY